MIWFSQKLYSYLHRNTYLHNFGVLGYYHAVNNYEVFLYTYSFL